MKYSILFLLVFSFFSIGCGSKNGTLDEIKETWKATVDLVNPPPVIDTDQYQSENPNLVQLAELFAPVDGPLTSLVTFVENTDTLPDIDWLELLLTRFPWVNTVMVTDSEGEVVFMQPETPIKQMVEPLRFPAQQGSRKILTRVDYTDLGPEMYIGQPYFKDVAFRGIIGVGFDPRTLLTLSPDPTKLFIIQPEKGVFARGPVDREALLAVDWNEILTDEVQGELKAGDKHYTWIVRYIGKDPYVYATESVEPNADTGWF